MRAAGIREYSEPIEPLGLPDPGRLRSDELLAVNAAPAGAAEAITAVRDGGGS